MCDARAQLPKSKTVTEAQETPPHQTAAKTLQPTPAAALHLETQSNSPAAKENKTALNLKKFHFQLLILYETHHSGFKPFAYLCSSGQNITNKTDCLWNKTNPNLGIHLAEAKLQMYI